MGWMWFGCKLIQPRGMWILNPTVLVPTFKSEQRGYVYVFANSFKDLNQNQSINRAHPN